MSSAAARASSHLREILQARTVRMMEQAECRPGACALPQKTKREKSAWMPEDQNAFSTVIKFYCVISAAPMI